MKSLIKPISIFGLLLVFSSMTFGQLRMVSGNITDEKGVGMGGVNVVIKGTTEGTATDANGKFSIAMPHDSALLVFTFIGYKAIESSVGNHSVLNVQMEPSVKVLSEMIVIGYGTQERKDVTGSVSTAKGEDISAIPASNLDNNFQGRLSGVTVIGSGEPGVGGQVIIRGASTFAGSSQPLYVVDGVPTLDISTLNPTDVEAVTALKDAGAASIYGSRAGNGVILITTKKGKAGSLKLTYSGYYGIQYPGKGFANLLNTNEYADLTWLVDARDTTLYGNGNNPVIPDYYLPAGKSENDPDVNPSLYNYDPTKGPLYPITRANKKGTNWYDEITHEAPIQSHDIAVSGGSDNSRYYVGFNYFNQQGIVIYTGAKRYSMRFNTEFKIRDKIRIGENITTTYRSNSLINPGDYGPTVLADCFQFPTILPVYDIAGNFTYPNNRPDKVNPYAKQFSSKDNESFSLRTFGNIYVEVDFLKNFTFRTAFGGSLQYGRSYKFTPKSGNIPNSFNEKSYDEVDWNWQNTVTFKKAFHYHSLNMLAGTEAIKSDMYRSIEGASKNYPFENPGYPNLGNGDPSPAAHEISSEVRTPSSLLGFFFRVDYSYHNRYLLSATVRRDGSSKFINHKYGTFPALTIGWRVSEESFLSHSRIINDLKVRAGYGIMGDQLTALSTNSYTEFISDPTSSSYDIKGSNTSALPGFAKKFNGNPNGQWQENKTTNVGVDFRMFNKWSGSIDVYNKITDKLLYPSEIPAVNGAASNPSAKNVGKMENNGIDLNLNYQSAISTNLKFDCSLTFTTYRNKVLRIANNVNHFDVQNEPAVRIQTGQPISAFYGYQIVSIWQSDQEVASADTLAKNHGGVYQQDAIPGRFRYKDVDGDSVITTADRTFIGNPNPDYTYGLNLSVTYKNFDFNVFFYGVQGNDIFYYGKYARDFFIGWGGDNKSKDLLYNSWTPERRSAKIPIAENSSNFSNNGVINSYPIEDGSYLRLRNIQIGYRIPKSILTKIGMSMARIYVQGANLVTWTKFSGLDPNVGGLPVAFGGGGGSVYPMTKQFMVGLSIEF